MANLQKITLKKCLFLILLISIICSHNTNLFSHNTKAKLVDSDYTLPFVNCWSYPINNDNEFYYASDKTNVYLSLSQGKLISLSALNGEKRWETELGGVIVSEPILDNKDLYVSVNYADIKQDGQNIKNRSVVRSIYKSTGVTNWELDLFYGLTDTGKVYQFSYKDFLVLVTNKSHVYIIDKTRGSILWHKALNFQLSAIPYLNKGVILLHGSDNKLIKYSIEDNLVLEKSDSFFPFTTVIKAGFENVFFYGDKTGKVISFDIRTGKINWQFRGGAEISSISQISRGILATSFDNFLYLLNDKTGEMIWKKRFNGRIAAAPVILDDFAIINSVYESTAMIIELSRGKTINNILLDGDNYFRDGGSKIENLFVFSTRNGIYAFSPKGKCQETYLGEKPPS